MDPIDLGLAIAHALNLAAGAIALGVPAVLALAILPATVAAGRGPPTEARLAPVLRRSLLLAGAAIVLELASGGAWLLFEAASMSGRTLAAAATPTILGAALWHTYFGTVLLLRLALAALALALLALGLRTCDAGRRGTLIGLVALVDGVSSAALAWAGHAVATPGLFHLAADALHVVAAGVWFGGLAVLALLFASARPGPSGGKRAVDGWAEVVALATQRFSPIGVAGVGTLIATGSVSTWYLVGTVPALLGTPYGHLLLVKLMLFAAMFGLAAINRQRLTPRLAAQGTTAARSAAVVAQLRRNTLAEAALGLAIFAVVAALGSVPPGLHDQPWWPFAWRFSLEATALPAVKNEIMIALALVTVGLGMCGLGVAFRRYRLIAIPVGLALVAAFAPSFRLLAVAAYPTSFAVSPVAYTTSSIASGRRLFAGNCVACHGPDGRGDGPDAKALTVPPADLTAEHVFAHSEGDLFWWLAAGIPESGMPGFADTLGEEDRWDLINFVRTLPAGGLGEGLADEVGIGPSPRAPEFTFSSVDGTEGTLQGILQAGPVLLVFFTPEQSLARLRLLAAAQARLAEAGLQILAVPLAAAAEGDVAPLPPFVASVDADVIAAYRLLASSPRYRLPLTAPHLEYLIDRNAYVRALWLPQETAAWSDVRSLLVLPRQLAERPLAPPSLGAHVH